jgi:hypothetical protein
VGVEISEAQMGGKLIFVWREDRSEIIGYLDRWTRRLMGASGLGFHGLTIVLFSSKNEFWVDS